MRRRSDAFQARVEGFRAFFQQRAPFAVPQEQLALEHVRSDAPLQPSPQTFASQQAKVLVALHRRRSEGHPTANAPLCIMTPRMWT